MYHIENKTVNNKRIGLLFLTHSVRGRGESRVSRRGHERVHRRGGSTLAHVANRLVVVHPRHSLPPLLEDGVCSGKFSLFREPCGIKLALLKLLYVFYASDLQVAGYIRDK